MLFIIAGADILLHEVTTFVDRLKNEVVMLNSQRGNNSADTPSGNYEVEGIVFDKMLHGWLDFPSFAIDENLRTQALNASERRSGKSWKAWIEYETSKHLLFSMFIMSSLLTTIYDIAPCISTAQVLGLELPSADALWEAPDERQWLDLQNSTTAQLPRLELKDVITPFDFRPGDSEDGTN
ncbi:hypothetical protein BDDG_04041 [Blastomyces dermatitidis ATCC 18188]|nr:hypothetical protein BDDG_04041 [Blastomyces dermatitidis ATCC 18188]EQL34829.1 hypothetical protein BDFG_03278 [Blastomyces dermatitidis ATCC 26199]